MKIIFSFLIIAQIYCSDGTVYDWNVKTFERDSDFGDELKIQTALNTELQNDLMKISGKSDDNSVNDDLYYTNLRKQYDFQDNQADMNTEMKDLYKYNEKYHDGRDNEILDQNDLNREENYEQKLNKQSKLNEQKDDNDNNDDQQHKQNIHLHLSDNHKKNYGDQHHNHHHNASNHNEHKHDDDDDLQHNGSNRNDHKYNNNKSNHIDYNYNYNLQKHSTDHQNNTSTDHKHHHDNTNVVHNQADRNYSNINKHEDKDKQYNNNKKEEDKKINNDNEKEKEYALINHYPAKGPDIEDFVGTNLFDNMPKKLFSTEELALLNTRRDFESLLPKELPKCLVNDRIAAVLIDYFYICHQLIIKMTSDGSKDLAQKAFYDTLGGYLNFYLLPVTKYSYYGGHISLNTVQNVLTLHQQCKKFLNTNGNGWKAPLKNVLNELKTGRIEPLHIDEGKKEETCEEPSFCMHLYMSSYQDDPDDDKMIVELPKLEAEDSNGYLGNIWLPFKRKQTFDLKSENAAYVVVKFYETVTKCYQFENVPQDCYNRKFKSWLLENIHVHLSDEQFYPGLGAVMRIYEYLKGGKKEITTNDNDLGDAEDEDTQSRKQKYERAKDRKSKEYLNTLNKSKLLPENSKIWINNKYARDYTELLDDKVSESDDNQDHSDEKERGKMEEGYNEEELSKQRLKYHDTIKDNNEVKLATVSLAAHSSNPKFKFRTLEFTSSQMAIIAIPVVALILVILICCYKFYCKKKRAAIPNKPSKIKQNSSSSSSNLLNSPVRFFNVKPKSASRKSTTSIDYSSYEPIGRRGKKSVKIDKKANKGNESDTSASSSPARNKKASAKSSSKSSWETTYSSK